MDHIRNPVGGIFPKMWLSHTNGVISVGVFGDFISEKIDTFKEEKTIGYGIKEQLKFQIQNQHRSVWGG